MIDPYIIISILGALLVISEALDQVPYIKANSIHRVIYHILKILVGKKGE